MSVISIRAASLSELTAYAAEKRWEKETGGVTIAGVQVSTSRDSQAMITGAYSYSEANPDETIKFKAASGWIEMDHNTVVAVANAVGAHVQACFSIEQAVSEAIAAGTITTREQIDAAFAA
ncbi:DUF4376 domain-containing protein [Mesorhizobium sp. WSM4906]|uniref:DUF4376 domain-containing protein n=1 Tax=Mesorhizobium sp. WSM4906 TaxID=3038546 RepID=UPI00241767B8|nr:DUF4376 domain-containing protein [Mesorhizobium sp. WSM4906]WFP74492.1 DUF4376 domain-containing protein [Mesorhizobium sp. WSM4906]